MDKVLQNIADFKNIKVSQNGFIVDPLGLSSELLYNTTIHSDTYEFTYSCQFKHYIKENLIIIVAVTLAVTFFIIKTNSFIRNCRYQSLAKSLYQDILRDLRNLEGGINGIS